MVSAIGASSPVAQQTPTVGTPPQTAASGDNKAVEKSTEAAGGVKGKGDTVTISPEAKKLTSAAQDTPGEPKKCSCKSKKGSSGKK